jgi:ABC-type transporter Mla subunit MlaD
MPDYEEIIKQSQANVKSLSEKLKDLDKLYQEIAELKKATEGIPETFNKKFQDIIKLSEDYTNILGVTTKNYLDGNNTLFATNLSELSSKIHEFGKEITRLENVDLEKHFNKFQKTLAEIFGAINAINLSLTNIIQTNTGIVQSLGTIQTVIDTNHKEARQLLNTFNEATEKHLSDQDTLTVKNVKLLEGKMQSISEQNKLLRKDVKTNRIIQIVGLTIIIIIIIYFVVKI